MLWPQGYHKSLIRISLFFLIFLCHFELCARSLEVVQDSVAKEKIVTREYWKKDAFDDVAKDKPIAFADTLAATDYLRIEKKYNSAEFDYHEDHVDRLSFWKKLQRRINQFLESLFPKWGYQSDKVTENVLIFLGIAALVYVIYRLVFSGNKVLGIDKKESLIDEPLFVEKNLERVDLDSYIQRAIDSEKFELAIRYLYLSNLQALAKKGYIEWDYRKTNNEFLNEIQDDDLKRRFQETTSIFNHIWFGEFEINVRQFERYKVDFLDFKNQISQ